MNQQSFVNAIRAYTGAISHIRKFPNVYLSVLTVAALMPLANAIDCGVIAGMCSWVEGIAKVAGRSELFEEMLVTLATVQFTVIAFVAPFAASAVSRAASDNRTAQISVTVFFDMSGLWVLLLSSLGLLVSALLTMAANPPASWAGVHVLTWGILNLVSTMFVLAHCFRFLNRTEEREAVCSYIEERILPQLGDSPSQTFLALLARALPYYSERLRETFSGETPLGAVERIATIISTLLGAKSSVLARTSAKTFLEGLYTKELGDSLVVNVGRQPPTAVWGYVENWLALAALVDALWLRVERGTVDETMKMELRCDSITIRVLFAAVQVSPATLATSVKKFLRDYRGIHRSIPFVLLELAHQHNQLDALLRDEQVWATVPLREVWQIVIRRYYDACEVSQPSVLNDTWAILQSLYWQVSDDKRLQAFRHRYPDSLLFLAVLARASIYLERRVVGDENFRNWSRRAMLDWMIVDLRREEFATQFAPLYDLLWRRLWSSATELTGPALQQATSPTLFFSPTLPEQIEATIKVLQEHIVEFGNDYREHVAKAASSPSPPRA